MNSSAGILGFIDSSCLNLSVSLRQQCFAPMGKISSKGCCRRSNSGNPGEEMLPIQGKAVLQTQQETEQINSMQKPDNQNIAAETQNSSNTKTAVYFSPRRISASLDARRGHARQILIPGPSPGHGSRRRHNSRTSERRSQPEDASNQMMNLLGGSANASADLSADAYLAKAGIWLTFAVGDRWKRRKQSNGYTREV